MVIDPTNPQILYVGTDQGILKSTNAGESWITINRGVPDVTIEALAIDPKSPLILYAGTSKGIIKSINGGEHWTPVK